MGVSQRHVGHSHHSQCQPRVNGRGRGVPVKAWQRLSKKVDSHAQHLDRTMLHLMVHGQQEAEEQQPRASPKVLFHQQDRTHTSTPQVVQRFLNQGLNLHVSSMQLQTQQLWHQRPNQTRNRSVSKQHGPTYGGLTQQCRKHQRRSLKGTLRRS